MIILIGMAGTGKSTQGERLAKKFGWKWVSAGQMLRDSGQFKEEQSQGKLVDLEDIARVVLEPVLKMEGSGETVILDGMPRGVRQAKWLMRRDDVRQNMAAVICLKGDKAELTKRLVERGRADDTEETIKKRLTKDGLTLDAVAEVLRQAGIKVAEIDAIGTRDEVQERIEKALMEIGVVEVE